MTTVRSWASAVAQIGSHAGSSSDISGGQIGKMPTGQASFPQRSISATEAATSRAETRIEGGPLAYLVSRHPGLGRGPPDQGPERRELRPIGGRQMLLDRLDGLDDVRVRVEDTIAAACHQRFSLNK